MYRAPPEKSAKEERWTRSTLASREKHGHCTRTTAHRREGFQNHARENKQTEVETEDVKYSRQREAAEYGRGAVDRSRGWAIAESVY